jgi:hypothetical protein
MPAVTGPTIPRWRLGEQLSELRKRAGKEPTDAAKEIGSSESKIRKIEAGDVPMKLSDLRVLLDFYEVADADLRGDLLNLQRLGNQRGWWAGMGTVTSSYSTFLGLESAATRMCVFEPLMIHGLLQTEDYARSIARLGLNITPEDVERQVQIRMGRQKNLWDSDEPPVMEFILDEAALRRPIGGRDVMHAQLLHLLKMKDRCQLQVIPLRGGAHHGLLGALTIFEFPERLHSPVPYVEGQAGNLYLEKSPDLSRATLTFNRLTAAALSPADSAELIAGIAAEDPLIKLKLEPGS